MLHAKLKVVGGRHEGRVIPLATKKFLIGREQDCHLRPNSELVSRHHCVLAVDDFSVRIRDLGSTNGTYVNDQRVRGEIVINSGDRIRVGKLDFELVIGEPLKAAEPAAGDSSQLLPLTRDPAGAETAPLATSDTSFEIQVAPGPEDTGSSILPSEPDTAAVPQAERVGDSTVIWSPPPQAPPGYGHDAYPTVGLPYPQPPYQPAYPFMGQPMGYHPYPQMPMGYPGTYPQMGMYPPAQTYSPPPPSAPEIEPDNEVVPMPAVRLPDPKSTGAKAAPPPPPTPPPQPAAPPAEAAAGATPDPATGDAVNWDQKKEEEQKPAAPPGKPSERAADILKNYVQRRPV